MQIRVRLMSQSSFSPQNELSSKAGLLARDHSTCAPSRPNGQWLQRAFVSLTVGRSCFGFSPNSLFIVRRTIRNDTLNTLFYYTPSLLIRQERIALLYVVNALIIRHPAYIILSKHISSPSSASQNSVHRKGTQYRTKLKISEDGSISIEQEPD